MSFCFSSKVTTLGSHCTWEQKVVLDTTIIKKNLCLGKKSGKLSLFFGWRTDSFKNVCFYAFCIWTYSVCKMGTNKGMSVALADNDMAKNDKRLTLSTKASSVNKSSCYTSSTRNPACNNEQTLPPSQLTTASSSLLTPCPASSSLAGWSKMSKLPVSLGLSVFIDKMEQWNWMTISDPLVAPK